MGNLTILPLSKYSGYSYKSFSLINECEFTFTFLIKIYSLCLIVFYTNLTLSAQSDGKIIVKPGIDVLIENNFSGIRGKNIALLTNSAGRTSDGVLTADTLINSGACIIKCILTPEHGFYTTVPAGKNIDNSFYHDIPLFSLYGSLRKPTKEILKGVDIIVIDLQDIGIRSYTYISTIFNSMQAAAEYGIDVIVLDRPNPIGGIIVDGNTVEKGMESFVSIAPVSYIHGCTVGELASLFNGEGWLGQNNGKSKLKCRLKVIRLSGWKRWMAWEDTGLTWYPTSPNIQSPNSVRGAAVLGIFGELGFINIGIGTSLPFQVFSLVGAEAGNYFNKLIKTEFPGLKFEDTLIKPTGKLKGNEFKALRLKFPLSNDFKPYTDGIKTFLNLRKSIPNLFDKDKFNKNKIKMFTKVTGTNDIINSFLNRDSDKKILKQAEKGYKEYLLIRNKYLMYD